MEYPEELIQHEDDKMDILDEDDSDDSDSSTSIDSNDGSMEDLEQVYNNTLKEIDTETGSTQANYNLLVETAIKLNDLDLIRDSIALCPCKEALPDQLKERWFDIEISLCLSSEQVDAACYRLNEAFTLYYSVSLAKKYLQLVDLEFASKETRDDIYNSITGSYCFDIQFGHEFFFRQRQYIELLEPEIGKPEVLKRTFKSYALELSLPINDTEEVYDAFEVFTHYKEELGIEQSEIDKVKHDFDKAKIIRKRITELQDEFPSVNESTKGNANFEKFSSYILAIKEIPNCPPSIIVTLFEKLVSDWIKKPEGWISYIKYKNELMSKRPSTSSSQFVSQEVNVICHRAICACPRDLRVQLLNLDTVELMDPTRMEHHFENALNCLNNSPADQVSIWLRYLTFLIRNNSEIVLNVFDDCWNRLSNRWGDKADRSGEILQMWSLFYYGQKNYEKGSEVFNWIFDVEENRFKSAYWIQYATLELNNGPEYARRIFKRAMGNIKMDNLPSVATAWKSFERVHGDISDVNYCEDKCKTAIGEYNKNKRDQGRIKKLGEGNANRNVATNRGKPTVANKRKTSGTSDSGYAKKPRFDNEQENEKSTVIRTENEIARTVFLSNLPYTTDEEELRKLFPELNIESIEIAKRVNGKSRGFAYMTLSNVSQIPLVLSFDRRPIRDRLVFVSNMKNEQKSTILPKMQPPRDRQRKLNVKVTKSKVENGNKGSNSNDAKKPMSNDDFRNLIMKR